ncbi:MAG: metallophosphoesterase [Clostridia bacterium]|nr:metallophosphoesterase [Clostridia bacterium]
MKKIAAILLCLFMGIQVLGAGAFSVGAEEAQVLFTDSFNYTNFGTSGLYDNTGVWEKEYGTPKDSNDQGSVECSAPTTKNGVLSFSEGEGIRFNWYKLSDFKSFDASKTYTVTFDVKVTDFGDDAPRGQYAAWNRELYFAVAGYYNQIEFRSGNYSGQIGMRAGDKTAAYPKGGWTNDKSTYALNKIYNCKFEWIPSQKMVVTTVSSEGAVIAQGSRTDDYYATLNKYTRFLVWRCEDGSMEVDNVTFSDGKKTYTQAFDFGTEADTMTASGVWGLEDVRKTDANAPEFKNGAVVLKDKSSIKFNWQKVKGVGEYDNTKTYIFEFDLKLTDKGDGSNWNGNVHTRAVYVAFGGWYNLIELLTSDNTVKLGSANESYTDAKYLNKQLRGRIVWEGTKISMSLCDSKGNVVIQGERSGNAFVDMSAEQGAMTSLVFRCEDGAYELDNFKFSVLSFEAANSTKIDIAKNKQAVYTAKINYSGDGSATLKYGGAELFNVENNSMRVGGKSVVGKFTKGVYEIESIISPDQEMLTVEIKAPNGEIVRRGFYTLLGGDKMDIFINGQSKALNASVKYESANINEYKLTTTEPTYSGSAANIYNVVTSFNEAQTTRNLAWTAKTVFIRDNAMAVKYRKVGDSEWKTVDAVRDAEPVYTADEDYFKCDLTGLSPNTEYEYKIGKKNSDKDSDWTQVFKFTTAENSIDEFTFLAVGDTQGITWNGQTSSTKGYMYAMAAIQEAFEEVENPAFLLHTGDVVENGNNKSYWNMFFKALNNYGTETPMFAAIGNHDTWGAPLYFNHHFNHPNNGGTAALDQSYKSNVTDGNLLRMFENSDELIYSYDYGDAHFIVLNSGSYCGQDRYILEAQRQWLINDLEANKDAKWTIMLFHQPVYHRMGADQDRPWLYDVIEGYGVDLVIQGHSHLVTRTYPMKDGKIVTKSVDEVIEKGTGTIYTTIGSTALNHDGAGDTTYEEEMAILATPTPTQPAYTTVTVNENGITVTTKQVNGFVLDSFTITSDGEGGSQNDNSQGTPSEDISDISEEVSENSGDASDTSDVSIEDAVSDEASDVSTDDCISDSSVGGDPVSNGGSEVDVSDNSEDATDDENDGSMTVIIIICAVVVLVAAVGVAIVIKRKKQ